MPAMRRKDRKGPGMTTISPDAEGDAPSPGPPAAGRTDRDEESVSGNLRATADKQAPVQRRPPAIRRRERRGKIIANTPQMCGSLNWNSQLPAPHAVPAVVTIGRPLCARLTSIPLSPDFTITAQIVEQDKWIMNLPVD